MVLEYIYIAANVSLSVLKDKAFARMFGTGKWQLDDVYLCHISNIFILIRAPKANVIQKSWSFCHSW